MNERMLRRKEQKLLLLQILIDYKSVHGFSPSYRELAELASIKSVFTISSLLAEMHKDGTIKINQGIPRSIVIL